MSKSRAMRFSDVMKVPILGWHVCCKVLQSGSR
jgi:hypothetical protein